MRLYRLTPTSEMIAAGVAALHEVSPPPWNPGVDIELVERILTAALATMEPVYAWTPDLQEARRNGDPMVEVQTTFEPGYTPLYALKGDA